MRLFACKSCGCDVTPENRAENRRICVDCNRLRQRKVYQNNREKIVARQAEYVANNVEAVRERDRKRYILRAAESCDYQRQHRRTLDGLMSHIKRAAHKKGLDFNLTPEDVTIPHVCPVLGIALDYSCREKTPSFDRVDNDFGYIKGNVRVISFRANRLKSDANLEELEAIAAYMRTARRA